MSRGVWDSSDVLVDNHISLVVCCKLYYLKLYKHRVLIADNPEGPLFYIFFKIKDIEFLYLV